VLSPAAKTNKTTMPTRAGYAYEPKLDGFRCLIRTEGAVEVRRRGSGT
jgi:ATP-dependent DNA ligase